MKNEIHKYLNKQECDDFLIDLFKEDIKGKIKEINYEKSTKLVKNTFKSTKNIFNKKNKK